MVVTFKIFRHQTNMLNYHEGASVIYAGLYLGPEIHHKNVKTLIYMIIFVRNRLS